MQLKVKYVRMRTHVMREYVLDVTQKRANYTHLLSVKRVGGGLGGKLRCEGVESER